MCTSDNKQIIEGYREEFPFPITYDKNVAEKQLYNAKKLYDIDILSFGSKIGFITNCSTYLWSLLYNYEKDSREYNEIINRLKIIRQKQGQEIDRAKGIRIKEFPKKYTTYLKDMTDLDRELVANKKPYFQRYIYCSLNSEYNKFVTARNNYSNINFNLNWEDNNDEDFLNYVEFKSPVLDNNSVMNRICHYLENEISEIKRNYKLQDQNILDNILIDTDFELKLEYEKFIDCKINEYKLFRKGDSIVDSDLNSDCYAKKNRIDKFNKEMKESIVEKITKDGNSIIDVANIIVYCAYKSKDEVTKDFAWGIFGEEIFKNVRRNSSNGIYIPVKCKEDECEFKYLNEYYKKEWVVL